MIKLNMFLVFEGVDGAGKDTQLQAAARWIRQWGERFRDKMESIPEIYLESEPTIESESGKELHRLLTKEEGGIDTEDQNKILRLYLRDRLSHSAKIRSLLKAGGIVLTSRYDLSSYAYQAMSVADDSLLNFFNMVYRLHSYGDKEGCLIPDITLFFSLPIEESIRRIEKRGRKQGFEKEEILKKVMRNYQAAIDYLKEQDGRRIEVWDSSEESEIVASQVRLVLEPLIRMKLK